MSKIILSYLFKTNLSSFRSAILEDNTDKICRILDVERSYLNKKIDAQGHTAISLAVEHASPITIRLLLEQGAQPDQVNTITLRTPLCVLASKFHEDHYSYAAHRELEMAKILLDYGALVDKPSPHSYLDESKKQYSAMETPLFTAARKKNVPLAKLFIERQANINYVEAYSQCRPIHHAVANGDEAMFDLLEEMGSLCSSLVSGGENTLLHWFCFRKNNDKYVSLLNKLIEKGCDVNAQNAHGRTPLMLAVQFDMVNTCRTLLKKDNINISKCDSNGNQAIDLSKPGSECSRILLHAIKKKNLKLTELETISSPLTMARIIRKEQSNDKRRFTIEITTLRDAKMNQHALTSSKSVNENSSQTCEIQRRNIILKRRMSNTDGSEKSEGTLETGSRKGRRSKTLKKVSEHDLTDVDTRL